MSYYATTNSPALGHRTVGTADDLALDPAGGRWVVICETHATVVNTTTLADAKATATTEFCEACMEVQDRVCACGSPGAEGYHSMLLCSVPPVLGSGGTAWVESGPDAAPYPPYKKGAVE